MSNIISIYSILFYCKLRLNPAVKDLHNISLNKNASANVNGWFTSNFNIEKGSIMSFGIGAQSTRNSQFLVNDRK